MDRIDREQFELELLRQLRSAQANFRKARLEHAETKSKYSDILDSADGAYAVHEAFKRELEALEAYKNAWKKFSDLVVHGKIPPAD